MHYVFFDIGSTLVDERKAYDEGTRAMIAESGISFEQFTAKRIFSPKLAWTEKARL